MVLGDRQLALAHNMCLGTNAYKYKCIEVDSRPLIIMTGADGSTFWYREMEMVRARHKAQPLLPPPPQGMNPLFSIGHQCLASRTKCFSLDSSDVMTTCAPLNALQIHVPCKPMPALLAAGHRQSTPVDPPESWWSILMILGALALMVSIEVGHGDFCAVVAHLIVCPHANQTPLAHRALGCMLMPKWPRNQEKP